MNFNFGHFFGLTVAFALAGPVALAADVPAPIPVAVAESESFEVVGRLEDEGFVFYIDRADSNAPVLDATLEVESAGKAAKATFRTEHGDYLIADAEWLKPLRQPGEYVLAMTLVAGADSDLLSADFTVQPGPAAVGGGWNGGPAVWLVLPLLLGVGLLWWRGRKGGRA